MIQRYELPETDYEAETDSREKLEKPIPINVGGKIIEISSLEELEGLEIATSNLSVTELQLLMGSKPTYRGRRLVSDYLPNDGMTC